MVFHILFHYFGRGTISIGYIEGIVAIQLRCGMADVSLPLRSYVMQRVIS